MWVVWVKIFYFNSHPHEEDDNMTTYTFDNTAISTHILTKRMTRHYVIIGSAKGHFNSHPHEEDDDVFYGDSADWDISTHILTKRMTLVFLTL